jgi:hypothetical protein
MVERCKTCDDPVSLCQCVSTTSKDYRCRFCGYEYIACCPECGENPPAPTQTTTQATNEPRKLTAQERTDIIAAVSDISPAIQKLMTWHFEQHEARALESRPDRKETL